MLLCGEVKAAYQADKHKAQSATSIISDCDIMTTLIDRESRNHPCVFAPKRYRLRSLEGRQLDDTLPSPL